MSEATTDKTLVLPASLPVSIENLAELLPAVETWPRFRKTAITSAVRMTGPFTVETSEGTLTCEDGWVAVDARGYPYPIADNEFQQIYAAAGDVEDEDNIYFVSGVTTDGEPHVMIQWGAEVMQVPPDAVRVFAMNALESAETAESDALLFRWLQANESMTAESAGKLLYSYRAFRAAAQTEPPVAEDDVAARSADLPA